MNHSACVLGGIGLASLAATGEGAIALFGSQTTGSVSTWGLLRFTTPLAGSPVRVGRGGLMFDFDFDGAGVLYSPQGDDLWRVNTSTGTQTRVGAFGITPNRRETGYGYIKRAKKLA